MAEPSSFVRLAIAVADSLHCIVSSDRAPLVRHFAREMRAEE